MTRIKFRCSRCGNEKTVAMSEIESVTPNGDVEYKKKTYIRFLLRTKTHHKKVGNTISCRCRLEKSQFVKLGEFFDEHDRVIRSHWFNFIVVDEEDRMKLLSKVI